MKLTKEKLKTMIAESLNELDYSATDFRDDPKLGQYPGQVTTYHEKHYKWAKRGSDNEYYENDMWPVRKIANMLPQNKPLDSNLYSKAPLVGQAPIIIHDPDVAKKISDELKPTFDKKFNKYYQLTSGMPKGFTLDDGWLPAQFHPEVAKIMSDRIASSKGVPYGTEPIDRGDAEKEMMKAKDTTARVRIPENKLKLTKEQLRKVIKEELTAVTNEFYARGPTNSREGEIISSKAWLKAFKEAGVEVPRSYHYQSNHKIDPSSNYRGAWGIEYDALADSGGPFREDLEQRAIEIHNQMKRDAERGPQLSSGEKEEKRIKDVKNWSDDEFYEKVLNILKYSKANPDVMDKPMVNKIIDDWQRIREG